jgi:hydroxymethylbilane synthase
MIRIATRSSTLALVQANHVADLLGGAEIVQVTTTGAIGDKSRFVRGVEQALLTGAADLAVHSAKDVPGELTEGLSIAAATTRGDPLDAWIGLGARIEDVPPGARIGTTSLRRKAQLLARRPDLEVSDLHGNVDSRIRKLQAGDFDAIVLGAAGLQRLGRVDEISFRLSPALMVPAPGQGVLALQVRDVDERTASAARAIGDPRALRDLLVERQIARLVGADCYSPLGVWAREEGRMSIIDVFAGLPDGSRFFRKRFEGRPEDTEPLGSLVTTQIASSGAIELLREAASIAPSRAKIPSAPPRYPGRRT